MSELKPCPNPKCTNSRPCTYFTDDGGWCVRCSTCKMQGPIGLNDSHGNALWNALPCEAKAEPVKPERKCPWCRQDCKVMAIGERDVVQFQFSWECQNCYMGGPRTKSERAAWRSLERMNRKQRHFPKPIDPKRKCPHCCDECGVNQVSENRWQWKCLDEVCWMTGPKVYSESAAWHSLERFNEKLLLAAEAGYKK